MIKIHAISGILAKDDPYLVNCPTRALRSYLARTSPVRSPAQKLLFLSLITLRGKDITKVTLARWVSLLIKAAYVWWLSGENSSQNIFPLVSPRAHEARALSTSLAVLKSGKLSDVLQAAYWKSDDVFINYYLRDVASTRHDGSSALPALVAAGQVLL